MRRRRARSRCTVRAARRDPLEQFVEAGDEPVRVAAVVVEVERGPDISREPAPLVERVDAVHARADHHVVALVQKDGGVVRVDSVQRERKDAGTLAGVARTEELHAGFSDERCRDACVELALARFDLLETDRVKIVERRVRPDHAGIVLQTRLEPVRRGPQFVRGERAPLDRLPAEEERAEFGDRTGSRGEHPIPVGPSILCAEIA
jgi:hypothetical protein